VTEFIYKSLDDSKKCATVYLDLSKAFDIIDHSVLLHKIEQLGLRNKALQLLFSYLSDRTQCVKINNFISSLNIVKCGVPQGTVISPILFNIQLNDIQISHTPLKKSINLLYR
jgi:hypothetical protein